MRKRVLSLLLAAVMVFSISGCGNSAEITGKTSDQEKTAEVSEAVEEQTQTETDTESKKEESASESEGQTENETEMVFAASRYACPGAQDAYYCSSAMGVWESLIDDGPDGPQGLSLIHIYIGLHDMGSMFPIQFFIDVRKSKIIHKIIK